MHELVSVLELAASLLLAIISVETLGASSHGLGLKTTTIDTA